MSTEALKNQMRAQALLAMGSIAKPRLGLVSSYDPNAYAVKVLIQPEGVESGWLPIASIWVGNQWGLFAPPSPNDQVLVLFQEGSVETGIVVAGLFNDEDRPLPVPAGELWVVHQTTSALKFHGDGSVELVTKADLNATVGGKLNATVQGDATATISGRLSASASEFDLKGPLNVTGAITATGDVKAGNISLQGHTHGGVQSGSSKTSPPS